MSNLVGKWFLPVLGLLLAASGCATAVHDAGKFPLDKAVETAVANLGQVRSRDILRRLAARHISREEFRSELQGFSRGVDSAKQRYDASSDPRFSLGVEAVRYCRFLLLMPPNTDPVEYFREDTARELAYEQLVKWSKLQDAGNNRGNGEIMDIELELAQSLGCSTDDLRNFDYSSLPSPGKKSKSVDGGKVPALPLENAVEILNSTGTAVLQLPRQAVERLIDSELESLRKLAAEYANTALKELDKARKSGDPAAASSALCRWRMAAGRLEQLR